MKTNPQVRGLSGLAALASIGLWLDGSVAFAQPATDSRSDQQSREAFADVSFTSRSDLTEGSVVRGNINTADLRFGALRTFELPNNGAAFVGGEWRQFTFAPSGAPVPDRLIGAAVKLGYRRELAPQWSVRGEIAPGIYSDFDEITARDLNAPLDLRCVYAGSPAVQWLAGLRLDGHSGHPLLGYGGVRWQASPDWLLLVAVPVTRVEYAATARMTLFADATLRTSSYRLAEDFGRRQRRPELDGQYLDYRQITATAGARWQLRRTTALSVSTGWAFDRRFEFHDRNLLLKTRGAPTIQVAFNGSF
jgi:hypothetical protein